MKTKTVNALKNMYKSYGGNIDDVLNINNIPDIINALSKLDISSGGDGQNEDTETVNALKELYVANGGNSDDVTSINTVSGMINALSSINGLNVDIKGEDSTSILFDVQVSTYQYACLVYPENILGFWTQVEGGIATSGPLSGTGYFIALKFINSCNADKIEVGVEPSESDMGLVELDSDMNAVFKVTDLVNQKIVVKITKDGISKTIKYRISMISM